VKLFYQLLGRAWNTVLTDRHAWEQLLRILDCYSEEQQRLFETSQENFVNLTEAVQCLWKSYHPLQYYGIQSTYAWEHFSCLATRWEQTSNESFSHPLSCNECCYYSSICDPSHKCWLLTLYGSKPDPAAVGQ